MERKKVVFIEPTGAHSNVFAKFMNLPLMGPLYLATIAERAGYDASVLNENILGREITDEELESIDILCLDCITATSTRGKRIAARYKEIRKSLNLESRSIVGGIHASTIPEDVIPDFDQVFVGEGERLLLDVLAGRIKDKVVYAQRPENLDELPIPNFNLLKGWEKGNTLPMMTSRGCPYGCNFCAVTGMFGRTYRYQSPSRVIDELRILSDTYNKKRIFFYDDNFAANLARAEMICDLKVEAGIDKPFSTQVRTDITKYPKVVAKMSKAGCDTVYLGLESVNDKSLKNMEKHQTLKDIVRAIKVFHDYGIKVHGMFMLGNDADTKDVFKRTSEFCHKNDIDSVQYAAQTPLPGTEFFNRLRDENRLLHRNWEFYDGLHVVHKPRNMTAYELQQGVIKCFSEFYSLTGGIKKAVSTFFDSTVAAGKNLYSRVHFPSFYPVALKIGGSRIVNSWISHNREYLDYLKRVSHIGMAKA